MYPSVLIVNITLMVAVVHFTKRDLRTNKVAVNQNGIASFVLHTFGLTKMPADIYAFDIESAVQAREMLARADSPDWESGSAEPWVVDILVALVVGLNARTVIEIGGFHGYTSKRLAQALTRVRGDASLTVCEIDAERAQIVQTAIDNALRGEEGQRVRRTVVLDDSLRWIPTLADASVCFAWVDGNHDVEHVGREIALLYPKMRPGGLICGHDVWGICGLWRVFSKQFGGISLNLPRAGLAGGLGIIQVPNEEMLEMR